MLESLNSSGENKFVRKDQILPTLQKAKLQVNMLYKKNIQRCPTRIFYKNDGSIDIAKIIVYKLNDVVSNSFDIYDVDSMHWSKQFAYYPISGKLLDRVEDIYQDYSVENINEDTLCNSLKFMNFFSDNEKKIVMNRLASHIDSQIDRIDF